MARATLLKDLKPFLKPINKINQIQVDWSNQIGNMDVILDLNKNG